MVQNKRYRDRERGNNFLIFNVRRIEILRWLMYGGTHSKMLTHCWRWLCRILSGAPRPRIQLLQRCLSPYQPLCLSFKDIRNTIQIVDLGAIVVLTNNQEVTNRNFLGKSGNYRSRLPDEKTMASWTRLSNQLINLIKLLLSSKTKIYKSHKLHLMPL